MDLLAGGASLAAGGVGFVAGAGAETYLVLPMTGQAMADCAHRHSAFSPEWVACVEHQMLLRDVGTGLLIAGGLAGALLSDGLVRDALIGVSAGSLTAYAVLKGIGFAEAK